MQNAKTSAPKTARKTSVKPKPNQLQKALSNPANVAAHKAVLAAESKAVAASAPATDKAADRAALTTRIATERATASATFAKLSTAISVPIKTLAAFKRSYKRDVTAHAIGRKPSPRQAAALHVALIANGAKLADNAEFQRKFTIAGADYAIENGALSDCIASGLCTYHSASETITLRNAAEIKSQIKTAGFTI